MGGGVCSTRHDFSNLKIKACREMTVVTKTLVQPKEAWLCGESVVLRAPGEAVWYNKSSQSLPSSAALDSVQLLHG